MRIAPRDDGRPLIKVCCVRDELDADHALAGGADLLGLVGRMPSGPGPIDDATIARVARHVGHRAIAILLTSERTPDAIAAHVDRTGVRAVQIVDTPSPDALRALRAMLPELVLVPVIHVQDTRDVEVARGLDATGAADAILLDSGRPNAAIPELGGTGRVHDWSLSAAIVHACRAPVLLAGGLRPDNVADALAQVRPAGFDVCSGLRTSEGALVPERLARFAAAIA
ncbi:phosphoribosylanthranilate isomerase [Sandaracinus amylolyticus]|uniref:phosphoribosylanthranilate isomerase n=1 Tax=Sandaracinus amylolyticus TaxID=927083 RepID=UPI001F1BD820|nr:phosphoribosylanthranilate isomerase [Sandaracinus amylolyticus]UJR83839.1 Hypothetical protein I5071_59100 [Sandaracinus amylolyticus]